MRGLRQVLACAGLALCAAAGHARSSIPAPLVELQKAAAGGDGAAASREFWSTVGDVPLIERVSGEAHRIDVTFLWKARDVAERVNIALLGSFAPGGPKRPVCFVQVEGTDVWFLTLRTHAHGRYRYYLAWPKGKERNSSAVWEEVLDGVSYELFADPLNARHFFIDDSESGGARTSYFEGPDAWPEPWLGERPEVKKGRVETVTVASRLLGNSRNVSIYTPYGYDADSTPYGVFVLFDREPYLTSVPTPTILDNMIAARAIPPLIAVLVSSIDHEHRSVELPANPVFAEFITDELIPWARARYRVSRDPRRSVIGGSSFGGLAAAYIALRRPDVFGNLLSQSGAYWWHPKGELDTAELEAAHGWLPRQFARAPCLPLRIYLEVGVSEGPGMVVPNRVFRDILIAKGYDPVYREFAGDHSYLNWRQSLGVGLQALLGARRDIPVPAPSLRNHPSAQACPASSTGAGVPALSSSPCAACRE